MFHDKTCLILSKTHYVIVQLRNFLIKWGFLPTTCVSFEISNLKGNHEPNFIAYRIQVSIHRIH